MKGQFMLISAIVAGLILISTASTISSIQSETFNPETVSKDISIIKMESKDTEFEDNQERERFKEFVGSFSGYASEAEYWDSKSCFNVTLRRKEDLYRINCLGEEIIASTNLVLELIDLNDFNTKGVHNGTSASRADRSGNLGIGYLDGEPGDSLKGFWRLDKVPTQSYRQDSYHDFWNAGYSPDLNIESMETDLERNQLSQTNVTVNASNEGFGTFAAKVSLYNFTEGDVSWTETTTIDQDGEIESMVPADIDHDGDKDLVWTDEAAEEIRYGENNGGSWNVEKIGDQEAESASVGDIDGDGNLDVIGVGNNDEVRFYENVDGDGSSWNDNLIGSSGSSIRSAALADPDRDGDLDILTTGYDRNVKWWENDGSDSGWNSYEIGSLDNDGDSVNVGDIDGDGDIDVVTTDRSNDLIWWENDGSNSGWNSNLIYTSGSNPFSTALTDINRDGQLDIISGDGTGGVFIYINEGDGSSWDRNKIGENSYPQEIRSFQVADIDMDGFKDLVIGTDGGGSDIEVKWFENDGTLNNWPRSDIGDTSDLGHYGVAVADLNEDGINEVATGEDDSSDSQVRIFELDEYEGRFIGSDTVSFTNADGDSRVAEIEWTPEQVNYDLVAELNPARNYTEVLETNDESAGSINNRVVQNLTSTLPVKDYSGEGNDGENNGAKRGFSGVFSTNSFKFDGSDVIRADNPGSSLETFTVSAWVYANDLEVGVDDGTDDNTVVYAEDNEPFVLENDDSGDWSIQIKKGGSFPEATSFTKTVTGEWVHLAGTYDGDVLKLYVNGQEEGSNSALSGPPETGTGDIEIGKSSGEQEWEGKIDEVRIYDEALKASEIKSLYFHGFTGSYLGDYESNFVNIDSARTVSQLEVKSNITSSTPTDVILRHSGGDTETIGLDEGFNYKNYSINTLPDGGEVQLDVQATSSDVELSPVIEELRVWTSK